MTKTHNKPKLILIAAIIFALIPNLSFGKTIYNLNSGFVTKKEFLNGVGKAKFRINELDENSAPATSDYAAIYDSSTGEQNKVLISDLGTLIIGGGATPTGTAGGDLCGTYPNPTTCKINGATLGTTTATSGNVLIGSGTAWETKSVSGDATISNLGALTLSNTAVSAGSYGSASKTLTATADSKGRFTALADLDISIAQSQVVDLTSDLSGKQAIDTDLTIISALTPSNDDFLQYKAGAWANRTVAQVKTDLSLTGTNSGDVSLSGENYLSLTGQAITANTVDVSGTNITGILKASAAPALAGDITSSAGTLTTTLATVNSSPGTFGSATQSVSATVNNKGLITALSNVSIQIAESQVTNLTSDLALKAPLASPALTGIPTTPTASQGNNSTQIASTAYTDTGLATKQGLDSTLTAFAAYNTNGILTQTSADNFTGRTITGTANEITITNGDGVSGNPVISLPDQIYVDGIKLLDETGNMILAIDGAQQVGGLDTSVWPNFTEFSYGKGVTSAIQTQLNSKASLTGVETLTNKTLTTPVISYLDSTKTNGVGSPYAVLATDSNTDFNNTGATALVYFALTANANTRYTFIVDDADGIRIDMTAGDTLAIGSSISASGGFVKSVVLGSTLTVKCINSTSCYAVSSTGTWTVDE